MAATDLSAGPSPADGYSAAFLTAAVITAAGAAIVPFLPKPRRDTPEEHVER